MSDTEAIFNIINNQREYIGEWLPFVQYTKEVEDTRKFVASMLEGPDKHLSKVYAIMVEDQLIGLISFKDINRVNKNTEIGYWLSQDFQGNGIVTKAVKQLCKMAFEDWEMYRIVIKCAVGNHPSKKIPQKIGFIYEGIERGSILMPDNTFDDLEVYSLLKSDPINY
ncbi:GNAT family N-acetyltransferase [Flammeovirga aprica JL-4]|uniref:GNAT family N-acetyltransferase n=2 Tax=Flammeovirga aprica TaxID=29528 RepID=A0A7X9RVV0_9BACT|nr:GNAT family N-acetyltransferase [Flammeovirga aprica JL-4]